MQDHVINMPDPPTHPSDLHINVLWPRLRPRTPYALLNQPECDPPHPLQSGTICDVSTS